MPIARTIACPPLVPAWGLALICVGLAVGAASLVPAWGGELPKTDWDMYRQSYISPEGRVVDTVNKHVSHSEGQGYGMLLAEAWADNATFDRLWSWTQTHLQVRPGDKLLAWHWVPDSPTSSQGKVPDTNNATDGDILVAWALYRASVRWERKEYFDQARILAREVRTRLLRRNGRAVFLLPAMTGFEHPDNTVLNLSYWVFPAFRDFQRLDPSADWNDLYTTGLALVAKARFGDYGLPTDWIQVSAKTVKPAERFEPLFSYNAIRVPLYLWWAGEDTPSLYEPYSDFLGASTNAGRVPASLDVDTNTPGEFDTLPGMRRILDIADSVVRRQTVLPGETFPPGDGYYSASLLMLARIALEDRAKRPQSPAGIELGPPLDPNAAFPPYPAR